MSWKSQWPTPYVMDKRLLVSIKYLFVFQFLVVRELVAKNCISFMASSIGERNDLLTKCFEGWHYSQISDSLDSVIQATAPRSTAHDNRNMIWETGRPSRISKQSPSTEEEENIRQAKWGVKLLSPGEMRPCLECGGWVGTQRSLDLLQIAWLTLGKSLPLRFPSSFKEPELSFTNICLGSAYH